MIISFIYVLIFFILIFIIYMAYQAINRGIEAKKDLKKKVKNNDFIFNQKKFNKKNIVKNLNELKKLHEKGVINNEEFLKAKKKILD